MFLGSSLIVVQGDNSKAHEMFQLFQKKLSAKKEKQKDYELSPEMDALVKKLEPALHMGAAIVAKRSVGTL